MMRITQSSEHVGVKLKFSPLEWWLPRDAPEQQLESGSPFIGDGATERVEHAIGRSKLVNQHCRIVNSRLTHHHDAAERSRNNAIDPTEGFGS